MDSEGFEPNVLQSTGVALVLIAVCLVVIVFLAPIVLVNNNCYANLVTIAQYFWILIHGFGQCWSPVG